MATPVKSQPFPSVTKKRKECPQNLSKAGKWAMKHPQGIGVITNRRAVNK